MGHKHKYSTDFYMQCQESLIVLWFFYYLISLNPAVFNLRNILGTTPAGICLKPSPTNYQRRRGSPTRPATAWLTGRDERIIRDDGSHCHRYHYDRQHRLVHYTCSQQDSTLTRTRYLYDPWAVAPGKWYAKRPATAALSGSPAPGTAGTATT